MQATFRDRIQFGRFNVEELTVMTELTVLVLPNFLKDVACYTWCIQLRICLMG